MYVCMYVCMYMSPRKHSPPGPGTRTADSPIPDPRGFDWGRGFVFMVQTPADVVAAIKTQLEPARR